MTNRRNDTKKSNFVTQSTISPTDTLDFVTNGTNKKILFSDFLTALGALGVLQQTGDPTASPILQILAGISYIRNIESGYGISGSISGTNGVRLDHGFQFDSTGVPLCGDPLVSQPILRSILAGTGVAIAASGDAIQISATGITVASNIVIVNQMSDFPLPVSGVITLSANTAYLVSASLTTSDRFVLGNNTLVYGADSNVASLTYSGTDAMFTSITGNAKLTLITLAAPNGKIFDIDGASTGIFQCTNLTISECDTVGTLNDLYATQLTDCAIRDIATNGILFTGSHALFVSTRCIFEITAGTMLDLGTATFSFGFSLETSFTIVEAAATFLDGAAASANMSVGALGTVFNTRVSGAGTALATITEDDLRWEFISNDAIANSEDSLLVRNTGTTVTISASSTPVPIAADWAEMSASRFSSTVAGVFTHTGKGTHVNLTASVTARVVSGVDDVTFYYALNGSVIANSAVLREFDSNPGNLSLIWYLEMDTNDYVEIYVENNDTSVDVVIENIVLSVH